MSTSHLVADCEIYHGAKRETKYESANRATSHDPVCTTQRGQIKRSLAILSRGQTHFSQFWAIIKSSYHVQNMYINIKSQVGTQLCQIINIYNTKQINLLLQAS